jgi:hypothetical protein
VPTPPQPVRSTDLVPLAPGATAGHGPVVHRRVAVRVADGLDGVLRVASVLRGRRYRVRDLALDVREGVVVSEVRATVLLTAPETDLLLERLRRVVAVISAERAR